MKERYSQNTTQSSGKEKYLFLQGKRENIT
jgi:hypothetical protein